MSEREEIEKMMKQFVQNFEKRGKVIMKKIEEGEEITNSDLAGLIVNAAGIDLCTYELCRELDEKIKIYTVPNGCTPEPTIYPTFSNSSNSCCGCTPEALDNFNKRATKNFASDFCKYYENLTNKGGSCNG